MILSEVQLKTLKEAGEASQRAEAYFQLVGQLIGMEADVQYKINWKTGEVTPFEAPAPAVEEIDPDAQELEDPVEMENDDG